LDQLWFESLGLDLNHCHTDRELEPHTAARFYRRLVGMTENHTIETGCRWLFLQLRKVVDDIEPNVAHLNHLRQRQTLPPRASIDVAAHCNDRRFFCRASTTCWFPISPA
jgi:hypothetical protein